MPASLVSRVLLLTLLSCPVFLQAAPFEVNAADRRALDLTVYPNGLGVVNDRRDVTLPTGEIELAITDVLKTIDSRTVSVEATGLDVLRQNFRFDLLNRRSLLERFVGRKLKYSRFLQQEGNYEKILREGILLSIDPEIVRFGDVIEIGPEGTISLPYLPDDLITEPTLFIAGSNETRGRRPLRLRYHAAGFSWEADYALTLSGAGELQAWVSVQNNSGTDMNVDRLHLIAGDVHQVAHKAMDMNPRMLMQESAMAPVAEPVGDYYAYDYPAGARLNSSETTRLNLFSRETAVSKSYRIASGIERYARPGRQLLSPTIWITLKNDDSGPGVPMPAGIVRVYQPSERGDTFLGEARIGHTPVDAVVELPIGRAFDLTGHRVQTSYRRLGDRAAEMTYHIELMNSGEETASVSVDETMHGDWRIVSESMTGEKVDATTYRFNLLIPPGEKVSVTYTVQVNG